MKNLKFNFMEIAFFPNLVSFSFELNELKKQNKKNDSYADRKNSLIYFEQYFCSLGNSNYLKQVNAWKMYDENRAFP